MSNLHMNIPINCLCTLVNQFNHQLLARFNVFSNYSILLILTAQIEICISLKNLTPTKRFKIKHIWGFG